MENQTGNALFIILIVVALFAALSYAITQSGQGRGNIDKETLELHASEILQYSNLLQNSVMRMQMIGLVKDEYLDFTTFDRLNYGETTTVKNNTNCNDSECEIYNPLGGAVTYRHFEHVAFRNPPSFLSNYTKPGHWEPLIVKIEGLGSDLPEIFVRLMSINKDLCRLINVKLGIPDTSLLPDSGGTNYSMTDDPSAALSASNAITYGNDYPDLYGKATFCQIDLTSSTENGFFMHAIKIR